MRNGYTMRELAACFFRMESLIAHRSEVALPETVM